VPARLFCRIQSFFSRLNKKLLLSLAVFIAAVFFVAVPIVKAVQNNLNTTYGSYINLFDAKDLSGTVSGTTYTFNQSGVWDPVTGGDLIQDATTKAVTGFKVNIALGFASSENSVIGTKWSHLADSPLIVRVCDANAPSNCWLNTITYRPGTSSDELFSFDNTIYPVKEASWSLGFFKSVYNNPIFITNYPLFSNVGSQYKYVRDTTGTKNEGTLSSLPSLKFSNTSSVQITLWYCAAVSGEADGTKAYVGDGNSDTIATFGTLCNGGTYFRIGQPATITIPATAQAVAAQVNTQQLGKGGDTNQGNLPVCGIIPGDWTKGTINGCAAQIAYGIYNLTAWVAGLFGQLFDFFIGYSLSDVSYRYAFAVTGWQLVRDISNVFFILIMVWTGFSAVFNLEKANMKSIVATLIINAFLINFSLFFTRIIIDVSNITARVFYNQMIVCPVSQLGLTGGCTTPLVGDVGGFPSLSTKIVSAFNPQKIFTPAILKGYQDANPSGKNNTGASFNAAQVGNQDVINNSRDYADFFAIVSLIAAALMVAIAIMFFKVTFLFLGRVVGLYVCMIFSPFAFLSKDLPMFGKIARLKWADWIGELTSYAMLAPVFIFFLYLIYTLLSSNFVQEIGIANNAAGGFFDSVLTIAIPLLIIYFLLQAAQEAAEGLSGDIGKAIQKYGQQVTGFVGGTALGIATGGTSLLGTYGAGALKIEGERRTRLEAQKASGGFRGQMATLQLQASDWTQKQTFNARNTGAVKNISKVFGLDTNNSLVNGLGFSSERTKGGREGQIKRAEDRTKKEINTVKSFVKDDQAAAFWEKHLQTKKMQKRLNKEAELLYVEKYKTAVVDKTSPEFQAEKQNAINAYGKITDNKKLTQALRVKYAGTIQNENILGFNPSSNTVSMMGIEAARMKAAGALSMNISGAILPAAALVAGAATDDAGKRKAAKTFLEDHKKAVSSKKAPRADRLEAENKTMSKELEAIEKTLEKIYADRTLIKLKTDPIHAGKSDAALEALVTQEVARIKSVENVEEAKGLINEERLQLKNKRDELALDVNRVDKEYADAIKKNDQALALKKKNERSALIAERNKNDADYDKLDEKTKRDLENNINKNDSELEKIKDKNKAAEEKSKDGDGKDGDKPKDDKK
jgi:hypothetical protein